MFKLWCEWAFSLIYYDLLMIEIFFFFTILSSKSVNIRGCSLEDMEKISQSWVQLLVIITIITTKVELFDAFK